MDHKEFLLFFITWVFAISCEPVPEGTGFDEPIDPNPVPLALWAQVEPGFHVAFGSIDNRYDYHYPPASTGNHSWNGSGWRGERINLQLKLWSREPVQNISVSASTLRAGNRERIDKSNIKIHPLRFVLTDEFLGGCGWRDHDTIPAHLASDMFEYNQKFNIDENTLRPVWITVDVPENTSAGLYTGNITVSYRGGPDIELPVNLMINDLVLTPPAEWSYHLDLWQNPFAIARYYNVEPWSEEHWELIPPYLKMLADAGQKCITASILHRPWGGQTYDQFESMIEWVHLGNGQWGYDYSVFDRWVETAMTAGITKQINCYSMVPWGNQVSYFDHDSSDYVTVMLKPGSDQYIEIWSPFLINFRDHLREKGWLDRTLIAMDERGPEEMAGMIGLLQEVTPELKIALAGNYHEEIDDHIYDLCVFHRPVLDKNIIAGRVERGKPTTFYTMCAQPEHPNNFTFSPPAEQAWLGWYAASMGFTGYLRWAYNSWVEDPMKDSRFRTWPAGDTYQIYPGPRSSIRFERLREGIQDFEKIRILRERFTEAGQSERLAVLDLLLEDFTVDNLQDTSASYWLNKGKKILNDLSDKK
ncbi:MAG: glycoside hydrolase domain-containing protein [Bacteroidales bacterium]